MELSLKYYNIYNGMKFKLKSSNWDNINELKEDYKSESAFIVGEKGKDFYFRDNYKFIQKVNINNKNAKIIIIGDFHSSFHSLYEILKNTREHFKGDTMELKDNSYMFFLGDIVDRGPYSIELLYFIFIIKIINFDKIFIIAGNHEDIKIYNRYGFTKELHLQFDHSKEDIDEEMYPYQRIFWYLPDCIYLNLNGKRYHLSHGSIVHTLDKELKDFLDDNNKNEFMYISDKRNKGIINYTWGDFDNTLYYMTENLKRSRGGSTNLYIYGPRYVKEHMDKFKIKMCITGHQDSTPIAFLLKEKDAGITSIEGNKLVPCNTSNSLCKGTGYNLHTIQRFYTDEDVYEFTINPENDNLLALVTSTAVIAKDLEFHCYLILESN